MLPRIPLVEDPWPFVEAGRKLSDLHLGYESVTPYPLDGLDAEPPAGEDPYDFYRVQKMAFAKVRDAETNKLVADRTGSSTTRGSPSAASRRRPTATCSAPARPSSGSSTATRSRPTRPPASSTTRTTGRRKCRDPRYIIDLLARIVTVSLETMAIVDALPALAIRKDQNPS